MVAASDSGKSMVASRSFLDVSQCGEAINAHRNDQLRQDDLYESGKGYRSAHSNSGSELVSSSNDCISTISSSEGQSPEVYLPGLVIHIVPVKNDTSRCRRQL